MKEKVLFISAIIGTFSAAIILLITQALTIFGVDTSGYVDIINIVGGALAFIILIVAIFFLNKYSTLQQKFLTDQNTSVTTALDTNASLINNILPKLANDIMTAAEDRATKLLRSTEDSVKTMMNDMLPELAKQTMQVVTQQSQDIVEQTTAKANATMKTMDELIPTYAKRISDSVAQTVRENNAHYHKMLTELKGLVNNLPAADANTK